MVSLRGASGSSLLELLIAMGISVCVLGASSVLAGQMQSRFQVQVESASANQEGRYAIDWISRYLRSAGNNPFTLSVSPCPTAGTPVVAIRLDPNGDGRDDDIRLQSDISPSNGRLGGVAGACTEADEDVTIAHDPSRLVITLEDHNLGGGAEPRTDAVVGALQFVYRDAGGNLTTTANSVAFVEIVMTVRSRVNDPVTMAPLTSVLRSNVRVRNR